MKKTSGDKKTFVFRSFYANENSKETSTSYCHILFSSAEVPGGLEAVTWHTSHNSLSTHSLIHIDIEMDLCLVFFLQNIYNSNENKGIVSPVYLQDPG